MSYTVFLLLKTGCAISFALSMYPTALCGRTSLGHAGTLALGAYLFALTHSATLPTLILVVFGFMLSYFTSHLSDAHFGALTLALGEAVRIFLSNTRAVGGASGYVLTKRYPFFALISLSVTLFVCILFSRSKLALYCKAQKDDETALSTLGVNTRLLKAATYALSCGLCTLSAVAYASLTGFLTPSDFSLTRSYEALSAVVLGNGVAGITVSAAALEIFSTLTQSFGEIKMLIYGIILILISKKGGLYAKSEKPYKILRHVTRIKRR